METQMFYYEIDYTYGMARLWTPTPPDEALRRFEQLASECFGIRKSVERPRITHHREEVVPAPWSTMAGATEVLKHSGGDTIVWNGDGEKIKSEWD